MIDIKGEYVLQPVYDDYLSFGKDGFAFVKFIGSWGLIDSKGTFKILPKFKSVVSGLCEYNLVRYGNYWDYIDAEGNFLYLLKGKK